MKTMENKGSLLSKRFIDNKFPKLGYKLSSVSFVMRSIVMNFLMKLKLNLRGIYCKDVFVYNINTNFLKI